jgi:putative ABC transport system permease protein
MKNGNHIGRIGSRRLITSNIRRRLFRNLAIIACFAFVAGTILSAGFLVAGAQMGVQEGLNRLGADMMVIPLDSDVRNSGFFMTGTPSDLYFSESITNEVLSTQGVLDVSPQAYSGTLLSVPWCRYSVPVMGFDPATDFTIKGLVTAMPATLQMDQVIVGRYIQGNVGSVIGFHSHNFTIVGRLAATGFSPDYSVYVTMAEAYSLAAEPQYGSDPFPLEQGNISAVMVKVDRTMGIDPVLYWITEMNPGVLVFPMSALTRQVGDQLTVTTQTLYLTVTSVILVSMPLVALIASMGTNERRREIGLLRAMGATQSYIFRLFFSETVFLAFVGGMVGVIGSSIGLAVFQDVLSSSLKIAFLWPSIPVVLSQISIALVIAVILAGGAAIWPALRASRLEPYDAIRRGQN